MNHLTRRPLKWAGFTLIELLVVVAIIALLISILLPSLARAREASKRVACAQNLKSINTACKTYAHDHSGQWPVPIAYNITNTSPAQGQPKLCLSAMGGTTDLPRNRVSRNINTVGNKYHVSPTRALWMLLQQKHVAGESFICPSSNEDQGEDVDDVARMHDFKGYGYLSYGYQIPNYPKFNSAIARENRDPRMVFLADKNPAVDRSQTPTVSGEPLPDTIEAYNPDPRGIDLYYFVNEPPYERKLRLDMAPELLMPFNSPNHGGRGEGQGQNVSRADGSTEFSKTPLAGVDTDNIYSTFSFWGSPNINDWVDRGLHVGKWPGISSAVPGYRGLNGGRNSNTDTMLFP